MVNQLLHFYHILSQDECSNHAIIEILLKSGADVNNRDTHGKTTLMNTAEKSCCECIDILIKSGADVNKHDMYGYTALLYAALKSSDECLYYLIEAGSDVNREDTQGDTALNLAVNKGFFNCVDSLIATGADVNATNYEGNTTLHVVFRSSLHTSPKYKLSEILLSKGANVNVENNGGETAMMKCEHTEIQTLLFAAGEEFLQPILDAFKNEINSDSDLCLKSFCRKANRKHLLQMSNTNLFMRIPKLGLPKCLQKYLLFSVSLSDDRNETTTSLTTTMVLEGRK